MGSESEYFGPTPLMARNIVAGRLIAMSPASRRRRDAAARDLAAGALSG